MAEATWGDAKSPAPDWRMSAALENVPRGDDDLAEVTSLERAVRAWSALDDEHRASAVLTPERPIVVDGVALETVAGDGIGALARMLPARSSTS